METYIPTTEQTRHGTYRGVIMVTTDGGFSYNERLDIERLTSVDAKLDAIAQIKDLKQLAQEGL